jgi:hypothetical protein
MNNILSYKKSHYQCFYLVCLCSGLFFTSFCKPEDLVKPGVIAAGWTRDTARDCYTGLIKQPEQLYEIIDGGAPVYIENGFINGVFAGYTDGKNHICMELYNQGTPAKALALYHAPEFMANGSFRLLKTLGDSARIDTSSQFASVIQLISGSCFIRLTIPSKNSTLEEKSLVLVRAIIRKILK